MNQSDARKVNITVDREACDGHLACVQLAPGTFRLDEQGKAIVVGSGAAGDSGADTIQAIRRAVRACPVDAITIEDVE